jgi:hypothetical protein
MLAVGARWFLWSEDVGPATVDLSFFSDVVDGRRRVLVQDSTGTSPGRRAIATCALLHAAGLFIDSQASLTMVFSWSWQWRRLDIPSGVCLDDAGVGRRPIASVVAGNPRDRFVFLDLLWFYLQSF